MKKNDMENINKPEENEVVNVKKEAVKEPKIEKVSSDAKVIACIIASMVIVCAALIFYYFFGVNNQVVATYEGGKVTRGEYEIYYKLFQPMLSYYGYEEKAIKKEVLNKIVIDKIVIEKANKEKVKIADDSKKEIDETFKNEEVNKYIEQGIDPEKMRQIYYDDALITAYMGKLKEEATEEKIKAFIDENEKENANYNKYHTSYILYSKEGQNGDLEKVKENAQAALDKILKGESFTDVGEKAQSENSTDVQYGADYDLYLNGTSVKAFENAVRGMKVGETTKELVESEEYGYFIIKVNSVEENTRIKGEDAADNYVNELLAKWQKDAKVKAKDKKINKIAASLSKVSAS